MTDKYEILASIDSMEDGYDGISLIDERCPHMARYMLFEELWYWSERYLPIKFTLGSKKQDYLEILHIRDSVFNFASFAGFHAMYDGRGGVDWLDIEMRDMSIRTVHCWGGDNTVFPMFQIVDDWGPYTRYLCREGFIDLWEGPANVNPNDRSTIQYVNNPKTNKAHRMISFGTSEKKTEWIPIGSLPQNVLAIVKEGIARSMTAKEILEQVYPFKTTIS